MQIKRPSRICAMTPAVTVYSKTDAEKREEAEALRKEKEALSGKVVDLTSAAEEAGTLRRRVVTLERDQADREAAHAAARGRWQTERDELEAALPGLRQRARDAESALAEARATAAAEAASHRRRLAELEARLESQRMNE